MAALKVVWRNPKPSSRKRRWRELACDGGRRLYAVEELVPQGDKKRWAQFLALEVISGCEALPKTKKQTWMQHILQGVGSDG